VQVHLQVVGAFRRGLQVSGNGRPRVAAPGDRHRDLGEQPVARQELQLPRTQTGDLGLDADGPGQVGGAEQQRRGLGLAGGSDRVARGAVASTRVMPVWSSKSTAEVLLSTTTRGPGVGPLTMIGAAWVMSPAERPTSTS
jgi:hypothetical protein